MLRSRGRFSHKIIDHWILKVISVPKGPMQVLELQIKAPRGVTAHELSDILSHQSNGPGSAVGRCIVPTNMPRLDLIKYIDSRRL